MTKHKVAELEGALLDAAVAMAEGLRWCIREVHSQNFRSRRPMCLVAPGSGFDKRITDWEIFAPSTRWEDGGPLIDIGEVGVYHNSSGDWSAQPKGWLSDPYKNPPFLRGKTALISVARAFVAGRLGEEIELPESA